MEVGNDATITEKLIVSSSKVMNSINQNIENQLDNLDLSDRSRVESTLTVELGEEPKPAYEIFKSLENVILYSEDDDESDIFTPSIDDFSHLAFVSQSVLSYIKTLSPSTRVESISRTLANHVTVWLRSIFLPESQAIFLQSSVECISKVIRLSLSNRFEAYTAQGVVGISHVSIYVNEKNSFLSELRLAIQCTGLAQSCLRIIPTSSVTGGIDLEALDRVILGDIQENSTPLMLCSDLGSNFTGIPDESITNLSAISQKYGLWLHLSGPLLTTLSFANSNLPEFTKGISSMTLDFENWLGVPSSPKIVLHKPVESACDDVSHSRQLDCFSLWMVMQNMGRGRVVDNFAEAFRTCDFLIDIVSKSPGFQIISKSNIHSKTTVCLFRFDASNIELAVDEMDKTNAYIDRLNSWLGQTLQRDFPQIRFKLLDHPIHGTCIRFSPFERMVGEKIPDLEVLKEFKETFESQADILCSTVIKRQIFNELVAKNPVLELVKLVDDWAGIGGIIFIPENFETRETDQGKSELNLFNIKLVEKLRCNDNAFSLGESTSGISCIRFGMVTSETDIEELLELVVIAGNELLESSRELDTLAEMIKQGIRKAEDDLKKENDEKTWNDGLLRVVPGIGSMLNWLAPVEPTGVRGRTLNLDAGTVESTENIYRYHVFQPPVHADKQAQIKSETAAAPAKSVVAEASQSPQVSGENNPFEES